ncbi:MAG: zinc ribbon domain-containing protein [Anaerolineae bacterium]|jgi:putative FmdB family regulatory protein
MPIYTYRCKDCGHEFDQRQRMTDDPLTVCPVCKGHIRRVVNSVGVVFKGSGFYVTDNRGKNSANNGVSSESKTTTTEKSDDAKSKPVPKAKEAGTTSAGAAA